MVIASDMLRILSIKTEFIILRPSELHDCVLVFYCVARNTCVCMPICTACDLVWTGVENIYLICIILI